MFAVLADPCSGFDVIYDLIYPNTPTNTPTNTRPITRSITRSITHPITHQHPLTQHPTCFQMFAVLADPCSGFDVSEIEDLEILKMTDKSFSFIRRPSEMAWKLLQQEVDQDEKSMQEGGSGREKGGGG